MAVKYETMVSEDLDLGYGTVSKTAPAGGTQVGNKIGLHTFMGWINVKQAPIPAIGNGIADDTAAIQSAIDAVGTYPNARNVFLPPGTYLTTSTLTIAGDTINFIGSGPFTTKILFRPTANGICLNVAKPANAIVGSKASIRHVAFYSDDSTYEKIAINLVNASYYTLEDIVIGGTVPHGGTAYWSGGSGTGTSIGIKTNGREQFLCKDYYIVADRPIVLAANPANTATPVDHFHFEDGTTIAYFSPNFEVENGVPLQSLTIDGVQAWVRGTYGFKWADNTAVARANRQIRIENVRWEQNDPGGGYFIFMQLPVGAEVKNLTLANLNNGAENNFYFRGVQGARLLNTEYGATGGVAIDVDATDTNFVFEAVNFDVSSIINKTGFTGLVKTGQNFGLGTMIGRTTGGETAIAPAAEQTRVGGKLAVGYGLATSHLVVIPNNESYGAGNAGLSGTVGLMALDASDRVLVSPNSNSIVLNAATIFVGGTSLKEVVGAGTPEGSVTAPVGSRYRRTDGGAATALYVKESGTGNTGWVGK